MLLMFVFYPSFQFVKSLLLSDLDGSPVGLLGTALPIATPHSHPTSILDLPERLAARWAILAA